MHLQRLGDLRASAPRRPQVDVEGHEESVLKGLSDADWARVRSVVLECEDAASRRRLEDMLTSRGFSTASRASSLQTLCEGSELCALYAARK